MLIDKLRDDAFIDEWRKEIISKIDAEEELTREELFLLANDHAVDTVEDYIGISGWFETIVELCGRTFSIRRKRDSTDSRKCEYKQPIEVKRFEETVMVTRWIAV